MTISTKFKNATDFRKSLEARLQGLAAKTNIDLQRLRRKIAFDRFLARVFSREKPGFYLERSQGFISRVAMQWSCASLTPERQETST